MELIKNKVKKTSLKKNTDNELQQNKKSPDEIWEELLLTPESKLLLELMSEEAVKEFKEGKTEKGGWGD